MTRTKKTSMNIPLSWYVIGSTDVIDIPDKRLWEYHENAIENGYESGFLKKGDKWSIKNNKYSFTITRYRK